MKKSVPNAYESKIGPPGSQPHREPKNLGTVLVFSGTGWFRHPEIPVTNAWLARLDQDLGMQVDITETPRDLETLLPHYKVLVLNNANELTVILNQEQRAAVEAWYRSGRGLVALHAATVRQKEWPFLHELAGCDFDSDSKFLPARVIVDPAAKNHPAVKGHGASFTYHADWSNHDRTVTGQPGFQVLLRVDESTYEPVRETWKQRGGKPMGKDHPIAWQHTLGDGRFFYTELGHDLRSLDTPFGRQHVVAAIKWAAHATN